MNCGLLEMLHCLNTNSENTEMSVLERHRSRLQWRQEVQHQPVTYVNRNEQLGGAFLGLNGGDQGLCELVVNGAMKPEPGLENGLNDDLRRFLSYGNGTEFQTSYSLPRTVSCPPKVAADIGKEAALMSSTARRESSKKRKADKTQDVTVAAEEKLEEKKMKGCAEEDSKITVQNSNNKSTSSTTATASTVTNNKNNKPNTKENSKVSEAPKTDYIHVRARPGQATDSHSLAERIRREKISERMKYLQDLVPGCNKITGKAGMLDEIINYVQSLQRQVEFLSMKLAAINPMLDFNVEDYLLKETFPSSVPTIGASSSELVNHVNFELNALGQGALSTNLEIAGNPMDFALRRTTCAPVSIPQTFLDSPALNQIQHTTWEDELQSLYNMEYHHTLLNHLQVFKNQAI